MVTEKTLVKFGFVKDKENLQLKEVLKDGIKLKEIHIDTYSESPLAASTSFMLLLRTSEKNATVTNDGGRIVLKRNDTYKTQFMNVLFSRINESFFKATESCSEFVLNIQNIYYKITVLN